ncbi:MAG: hypothetical protein ACPIA7_07270 [Akkermansiaceae bacterium]
MKTYLVALFVATLALQTHAADLANQLVGYWVPDVEKTYDLAKKENRTITRISRGWMPKLGWEFGSGTMLMHFQGNQAVNPPDPFSIKRADKANSTLVLELEAGKPEYTVIFTGHDQLTLIWEKDKFVLNRISKEAFAERYPPPPKAAADVTEDDIPAGKATGSVAGVAFTVQKATLSSQGNLTLRQGEDFFPDQAFEIFIHGSSVEGLAGKTILVKPDPQGHVLQPHINLRYKVEGSRLPESENYLRGYSMKLEFGTVSDGKIPGKIHLRLPDEAKSFVAGAFEAEVK